MFKAFGLQHVYHKKTPPCYNDWSYQAQAIVFTNACWSLKRKRADIEMFNRKLKCSEHVLKKIKCKHIIGAVIKRSNIAILHASLQWLRQNIYPGLSPHCLPYGLSFVRIWVNFNRVITELRCIISHIALTLLRPNCVETPTRSQLQRPKTFDVSSWAFKLWYTEGLK